MDSVSASKLRIYSLGIVAANKPLGSKIIEVTPSEEFSMLDGEITDNVSKYKSQSSSATGSVSKTEVNTTATIKAKWLSICGSNRMSAPDVRRGEQVAIYRFADVDEYWWVTMTDDLKMRRLETVIFAFSNNPNDATSNTNEMMYFLEISTHKKLVHFHTAKNDGEFCSYDVQINAKDGRVVITDDIGNFFVLDSKERQIAIANSDGTIIEVNKQIINLKALESINIETGIYNLKASKSTYVEAPANTIKGDTSMKNKLAVDGRLTMVSGFDNPNNGVDAGMSTVTGNMIIQGNVDIDGTFKANATLIKGPLSVQGAIHATDNIKSDTLVIAPNI